MAWEPKRPTDAWIKVRKAEIAKRYAWHEEYTKRPRTMAALRLAELTKLYDHRYSRMYLPESDHTLMLVRIMAHHMASLPNSDRRIQAYVLTCANWLPLKEMERLIREVMECPLRWRATKLGWKLRLTDAERTALKIKTIAPYDMTPAQLAARRKQRQRLASAKYRQRKAKERAPKPPTPWAIAGISRATWYRQNKPETKTRQQHISPISM